MLKKQLLLVEDDKDILKINKKHLEKQGYSCLTAATLEEAYNIMQNHKPSLLVLDIQLPDGSGVSFCEKIRQKTTAPIIFLTGMQTEQDKVNGLMAGGDDYMTKPYGLAELTARIHTLLRRVSMNDVTVLEYPPIKIDITSQIVYLNDKDALLTPKEFQILLILVKNIGRPIEAEALYKKLWGTDSLEGQRIVPVRISSIRKKLGMDYDTAAQIKSIRNVGYCFEYEKDN